MSRISRRRFVVAATGPAVLALTVGGFLVAQGAKASDAINVSVEANTGLGTIPGGAVGVNTAVFDGDLNDGSAATSQIGRAHV